MKFAWGAGLAAVLAGCTGGGLVDAGGDAGVADVATDANDASSVDVGPLTDASATDVDLSDVVDVVMVDAADVADAQRHDVASRDVGVLDSGTVDAGAAPDAIADAGPADTLAGAEGTSSFGAAQSTLRFYGAFEDLAYPGSAAPVVYDSVDASMSTCSVTLDTSHHLSTGTLSVVVCSPTAGAGCITVSASFYFSASGGLVPTSGSGWNIMPSALFYLGAGQYSVNFLLSEHSPPHIVGVPGETTGSMFAEIAVLGCPAM